MIKVEVKQITLSVNGREKTFTEEELINILEQYFKKEVKGQDEVVKEVQIPTEGRRFKVKVESIDQSLFQRYRHDSRQESTRRLILEAFEEIRKNPRNYPKQFEIMIPEKNWETKTVQELKQVAENMGGHIADWVEQTLYWAHEISQGKTWEIICNDEDTEKWYRLIVWKNGLARYVGGSTEMNDSNAPSDIGIFDYGEDDDFEDTVPSVVFYK